MFVKHRNSIRRIYETLSTSCKGADETAARIVLVHNPRIAAVITRNETLSRYADIVISGHVHAGQFYLIAPLPWIFFPYYYGHYPPKYGKKRLFCIQTCNFVAFRLSTTRVRISRRALLGGAHENARLRRNNTTDADRMKSGTTIGEIFL